MMLGARAIGQLPNWGHCKDSEALTHVYEDEAQQGMSENPSLPGHKSLGW